MVVAVLRVANALLAPLVLLLPLAGADGPVPSQISFTDAQEVARFSRVAFGPAVAVAGPVVVDLGGTDVTLLGVGQADPCEAYASHPCQPSGLAANWYARPPGIGEPGGVILYAATLHVDLNGDGLDEYRVPGATFALDQALDANGDGFDEASVGLSP